MILKQINAHTFAEYQQRELVKLSQQIQQNKNEEKQKIPKLPKIYYGTRTHRQIQQIVKVIIFYQITLFPKPTHFDKFCPLKIGYCCYRMVSIPFLRRWSIANEHTFDTFYWIFTSPFDLIHPVQYQIELISIFESQF